MKLGFLADPPPPERQHRTCAVLNAIDRLEAANREPLPVERLVSNYDRRLEPESRKGAP
jgi:hypothetical protein